jgi:hypothetical protein
MIVSGLIGLFTGAVILSIAYKLFMIWLSPDAGADAKRNAEGAQT